MALNISLGGGDADEFMTGAERARRQAAQGGGMDLGTLIGSLLDAVGIHKQVAKGGESGASKKQKKGKDGTDEAPDSVVRTTPNNDVLALAETALTGATGLDAIPPDKQPTTDWGKGVAQSLLLKPLGQRQIDPDLAARGILKPVVGF